MSRPRHPNKEIERVVRYAETLGWRVEKSRNHAWGHLLCPQSTREGCIVSVWSTPRNPESHARNVRSDIDLCPHTENDAAQTENEDDGNQELV